MTSTTEKLKRMIERAIENGWDMFGWEHWEIHPDNTMEVYNGDYFNDEPDIYYSPSDIIFSEGFGKSYWGEDMRWAVASYGCDKTNYDDGSPHWDGNKETDNSVEVRVPAYIYHQRNLIPFKDDAELISKAYKSIFGGEDE